MRRKRWIGLITMAVAAALLSWWWYSALRVNIIKPTRGSAVAAIYATGVVESSVLQPIAPRVSGHLRALHAVEGQAVRKGQLLAELDALDALRSVDEQAARAKYARQQQARTAALVAQGFYSGAELDRVTAEANATQAALRRTQALQAFTVLRAPADGIVLRRDAEIGQFVAAGQVLMTLGAKLRVSAEVDEEDIPDVHVGQKVVLRAPAFAKHIFDGQVESITPQGDPISRSYRVRIHVPQIAPLREGMSVEANLIQIEKSAALLIPSKVLQNEQVWLLENGRLQRRKITLGIVGAERSEVLAGLNEQSQIVWPWPAGLRAGRRGLAADATTSAAKP